MLVAALVATTSAATSCSSTESLQRADAEHWPVPDWSATTAEEAGIDPTALADLAAEAGSAGSDCLLVAHDGRLVDEWYWDGTEPDTPRDTFSITKSMTSVLVGIAVEQGYLDIERPASEYITEWAGTPSAGLTIRDLLSHTSGRRYSSARELELMTEVLDKTSFAVGLDQQHEPGEVWVYNNNAVQTLDLVLRRATGEVVSDYAADHLFGPLGMHSWMIEHPPKTTWVFSSAQASCRDVARFGLMVMRGGEWNGTQVVPSDWISESLQASSDLNPAHGYLWWLLGTGFVPPGDVIDSPPTRDGEPLTEPYGFAAVGFANQVLAVFPDQDLIIVRLGAATGEDGRAFGLANVEGWYRAQFRPEGG